MKSIAVFNNKGGVGKTTFLCNLAASLSVHHKKKILVIDADPQCNATQYMFNDECISEMYEEKAFTILNIVTPLSLGKGFADGFKTKRSTTFCVDTIPGDPAMALKEDLLANDWVQATGGDTRGLRTTFLFRKLLSQCSKYDFVFFDMGPSLGSINRAVLIAADFYIAPMSTDIFSLRAIDNIAASLSSWRGKLTSGLASMSEPKTELEVENPAWTLQFLGYITQQYRAKTIRGKKQPVDAFDKIAKKIPSQILKQLIGKQAGKDAVLRFELGSIPTLNSLVPLSQSSHTPIFSLRASDGVVGAHFAKVREYDEVIQGIAKCFLNQVKALS